MDRDFLQVEMLPPTSYLPAINKISEQPAGELQKALRYLRLICLPGTRNFQIHTGDVVNAGDSTAHSWEEFQTGNHPVVADDIRSLRSDKFECSYAVRWLTALISQVETWENAETDTEVVTGAHSDDAASLRREAILQEAASLLAICAGPASAGTFTRTFTFASRYAVSPITIQLRDIPLENQEFASVGAQTWGSARVLAERIAEHPEDFGLFPGDPGSSITRNACRYQNGLRVLELGAGTGLVSLTFGKLLEASTGWSPAKTAIVATDVYPSVLDNLRFNIAANFPNNSDTRHAGTPFVSVSSHSLDWSTFSTPGELTAPFDEPFDLVLGADIVYETQHAMWIKSCLETLLRKPTLPRNDARSPGLPDDSSFHLIIPLRPTHTSESGTIEDVFRPFDATDNPPRNSMDLVILSREDIVCPAPERAHDFGTNSHEVEYAYYKIGWRERGKWMK